MKRLPPWRLAAYWHIGPRNQLIHMGGVGGKMRCNAGAHVDPPIEERDGQVDGAQQSLGHSPGAFSGFEIGQDQHELVAAHTGQRIPLRTRERRVLAMWTSTSSPAAWPNCRSRVEAIQIDEEQGNEFPLLGFLDGRRQAFHQPAAIGQLGEGVDQRILLPRCPWSAATRPGDGAFG